MHSNMELIKVLVEGGVSLNEKGENDATALMLACLDINIDLVKYLIEEGANVNQKSINY